MLAAARCEAPGSFCPKGKKTRPKAGWMSILALNKRKVTTFGRRPNVHQTQRGALVLAFGEHVKLTLPTTLHPLAGAHLELLPSSAPCRAGSVESAALAMILAI